MFILNEQENQENVIAKITVGSIFVGGGCLFFLSLVPMLLILAIFSRAPSSDVPIVKHGEFPFHIVYEIDGERRSIDETIICDYIGKGMNEDQGNFIEWEGRLANANKITNFFGDADRVMTITLYEDVIDENNKITCDIGNPQYYLGYYNYEDYKPGRIRFSNNDDTALILDEVELWEKYKIKIIEMKFSEPAVGNKLSLMSEYNIYDNDLKDITVTPEHSSYPPDTNEIVFIWKNETHRQLLCSERFYLQRKSGDDWKDVYRDVSVNFSEEIIKLQPYEQISRKFEIGKYTDDVNMNIGLYRIVSPIQGVFSENDYQYYLVFSEFTITK